MYEQGEFIQAIYFCWNPKESSDCPCYLLLYTTLKRDRLQDKIWGSVKRWDGEKGVEVAQSHSFYLSYAMQSQISSNVVNFQVLLSILIFSLFPGQIRFKT